MKEINLKDFLYGHTITFMAFTISLQNKQYWMSGLSLIVFGLSYPVLRRYGGKEE